MMTKSCFPQLVDISQTQIFSCSKEYEVEHEHERTGLPTQNCVFVSLSMWQHMQPTFVHTMQVQEHFLSSAHLVGVNGQD